MLWSREDGKGSVPEVEACMTMMLHREQRQWRTIGMRPYKNRCKSEGCNIETMCDNKPSAGKEKKSSTLQTKSVLGGSYQGGLGCSSE